KQRAVSQRGSIGGQIMLTEPLGRTLDDFPHTGITQSQKRHGIPHPIHTLDDFPHTGITQSQTRHGIAHPTHSQYLTAHGPRSLGISHLNHAPAYLAPQLDYAGASDRNRLITGADR